LVQHGAASPLSCDGSGPRPKVTKIKGSLSAPEGPVSTQHAAQQQQQKWQASGLPVAAAAAAAGAAAAVGQQQQQQQPGGLQQALSAATDEFECFSDANDRFSGSEAGSTAPAAATDHESDWQQQQHEQQQQIDSSSGGNLQEQQQVAPLPYTEAELGAMIGGTLNRQYWESIHDGAGSVRDVYSIRGPHYLRDRKKIPAGELGAWVTGSLIA
jgi:hypothetical protein